MAQAHVPLHLAENTAQNLQIPWRQLGLCQAATDRLHDVAWIPRAEKADLQEDPFHVLKHLFPLLMGRQLGSRVRHTLTLHTKFVSQDEDGLSQVEIAVLLGRHKSFVCRRLQLVEKLSGSVLDHLKLGLINITTARELARLPHGNQAKALSTIIKHRFTSAETSRLVSLLLREPRWNHANILYFPEPILKDRQSDPPPADDPLLSAPNMLMTPHIGASSRENLLRIGDIIERLIAAHTGQTLF